jgi:hypothetical protein
MINSNMRRFVRLGFAIICIGLALLFAGSPVSPAVAQGSITTTQGVMAPSGQVPFVTQDSPVVPTPEQLQAREEALQRTNRDGPALPVGPTVRQSPALPATEPPGAAQAPITLWPRTQNSPSPPATPPAPGTMTNFLVHDQAPFSGQSKSYINEPSAGNAGSVVFISSNWDASFSTDGGNTFSFVNPYTLFPSVDGGFCCDQSVLYHPGTDTMIWQIQYIYSATTQKNTYRVAFARASSVATSGWCYYDFTPQNFGQPAGANFDYPDMAVTNNFVYLQSRVFPASGNALGTAIWRIPLAQASQCQTINYSYSVFTDAFTFSLAQGATTTMYWFRHLSTTQERLFNWPESPNTISWNDINVTTWYNSARSCPAPDGQNWCGRNNGDTIGRTSWVAGGVIGSMWSSSQGGGRNFPYVKAIRINESAKTLIDEPDLWSNSTAWIFPAVNINSRGALAGVVFFGGNGAYPTMSTLIWDDVTSAPPPPWEVYFIVASSKGEPAWGDYYSTRRHAVATNTWVGTGEYIDTSGTAHTYYLWFGRFRDGTESPPTASKFFSPATIHVGQSSTLFFSVNNPNGWASLTGVGFSDTLPSGLVVATPNGLSGSCGGGTITATAGTSSISLSGATLGASASCFFSVSVTGTTIGTKTNVTSLISSNEGGSGSLAIASITVQPSLATHDFNGDGKSDIGLRDTSGNTVIWLMNGIIITNPNSNFVGNIPVQWSIVGQRDFNGDGKADLLWRDTSGNVAIWEMNGIAVLNPNSSFVSNVPTNWSVVGTGDFNGDGIGDILWRDTSGNVAIWEMNGTTILNPSSSFVATVPVQWSVKGTGDFNGDGKADILWQDTAGNVAIWEMNGTTILNPNSSTVSNVPAQWSIKGTGDFNGDGKADIVWQDTAGNVAIWEMNGIAILNPSSSFVASVPSQWSIQLTGDLNGDGRSDILWQDTSRNLAAWEMNGITILNPSSSFVGNLPGQWSVQYLAAE